MIPISTDLTFQLLGKLRIEHCMWARITCGQELPDLYVWYVFGFYQNMFSA
jgi:hypothetical protein